MKLLVVDDDPVTRLVITRMLIKWGYDVVPAASGEEAWQAAQALREEGESVILVVDRMMPGMNGFQLCRKVTEAFGEDRAYKIVFSSSLDNEDKLLGTIAGADTCVVKSLDFDELRRQVSAGAAMLELRQIKKGPGVLDRLSARLGPG